MYELVFGEFPATNLYCGQMTNRRYLIWAFIARNVLRIFSGLKGLTNQSQLPFYYRGLTIVQFVDIEF